jgi:hypothetical protein
MAIYDLQMAVFCNKSILHPKSLAHETRKKVKSSPALALHILKNTSPSRMPVHLPKTTWRSSPIGQLLYATIS